jgi:N-acetylglucosaminyldiphosphoundecaprenol N-acetyl-beta-D-mannosaminyltransferase
MSDMKKTDIFGIKFDNLTDAEIARLITDKAKEKNDKPFIVFTPNPEIVMASLKDKKLSDAMQAADIIAADGIGIVWASKYFGAKIKQRASGYDIIMKLFEMTDSTFFFLGGAEDTVNKAARNMEERFALSVTGVQNGYFDNCDTVIETINTLSPDILLVGLGSPKQELWVTDNMSRLNVGAIMVVGGSFDVMSGKLKRAPVIFQKAGLEWFYRLYKQPKRFFRMLKLPLFVIKVLSPKEEKILNIY